MKRSRLYRQLLVITSVAVIIGLFTLSATAQIEDVASLKVQGRALIDAQKFTEALPIYERLAKLAPKDPEVFRNLGFSLLGQSLNVEAAETKRQLRVRARDCFVFARDFGDNSLLVKGLIEGLPPDGAASAGYSNNAEANKRMETAEAFFSTGKLDDAFKAYQEALALDPQCYHAALFSGDAKMQANSYDEAEKWYQRAIAINPNIETAYRYSATPLMKQGKYDLARDRYVESYIIAPYDSLAISGIVQWAQATKTPIGHPKIDIPEIKDSGDRKSNAEINISPGADGGSIAWASYVATRQIWHKEKFAKQFPKAGEYRHSLMEEAEALRSVIALAKEQKPKSLNPQIDLLQQMDQDGVLEAYILMALPDRGIAQDHHTYLLEHRDKLRKYVVNYVIGAK